MITLLMGTEYLCLPLGGAEWVCAQQGNSFWGQGVLQRTVAGNSPPFSSMGGMGVPGSEDLSYARALQSVVTQDPLPSPRKIRMGTHHRSL